MAALAARFHTLAFDHRGTGRNAGALPEPHSVLHMAEDAGEVMQAAMPSPSSSRSRSTACRWNSSAADIGTANRSAGPVATAGGRHSEPGFRAWPPRKPCLHRCGMGHAKAWNTNRAVIFQVRIDSV
jgi:hypothetical protein